MNPLRSLCLVACLLLSSFAAATPNQRPASSNRVNSLRNSLKPTEWLTIAQLENVPSVQQVKLEQLENMSNNEGADLINQLYHLSQINYELTPNYAPEASDVPTYVMRPNGEKQSTTLNHLVATAKQQSNFGDEEVTIFITGLPSTSKTVSKATKKLVEAYKKRYNVQEQKQRYPKSQETSSSEESESSSESKRNSNTGNLVVIDLGAKLNTFERLVMLDVERTGAMIGKVLVQLTNQVDVPQEIIHLVGQGVAAHVAGAAARQFTRNTGHQLRRITALDPSKIYAKQSRALNGLSRGDAEFVDAIHTSCHGMGTPNRVGDVDFYPNGPSVSMPGTDNIVEASMRATRYFAESVVPGMERNFPAVAANSLNEYKSNDGNGQRAYMGIDTDFDLEGDYILQVNAQSPFGKLAPAQKQNNYHGVHPTSSKKSSQSSQEN